ncbi:Maf family protein, partial [bacterium]|nr:Maf family protein [candidate division CSSED10-310 bacterium]
DIIGKPRDASDAVLMLQRLSGCSHRVVSGIALIGTHFAPVRRAESTIVRFRTLSPAEIDWYVGTGDGLDKAGAYGIQSLGGALIESIQGDWFNVVGLPLPLLLNVLPTRLPGCWPPTAPIHR